MAKSDHIPSGDSNNSREVRSSHVSERTNILARNIMSTNLVTVDVNTTVRDIARLFDENNFSAVPVVDGDTLVGIVTEGDLLRRDELGTAPAYCSPSSTDPDCLKSHGQCARDVMTRQVVTVNDDTTLAEIAEMIETKQIKHVLVLRAGKLAGIVSRADIVRALVARPEQSDGPMTDDDDIIRFKVIDTLIGFRGASAWLTSVRVLKGMVHLDGTVEEENARGPSRRAIEKIPGVVAVDDHRSILVPY